MRKLIRRYESVMHGNYHRMSLRYGLVIGAIMILSLLLRYLMIYKPSSPMTIWDNIAMLVLMACCVFHYRSSLENKKITFKESWLVGFYSGCVAAVLFGVFMYIYAANIDSEMSLRCANNLREIEEYQQYTPEDFAQMTRPSVIAFQYVIYNIIMAILWAFVIGILLKNEDSQPRIKEKQ